MEKRLVRGDPGVNPLDAASKEHDITYSRNRENIGERNAADKILADRAWNRVQAADSTFGEEAAALGVTRIMEVENEFEWVLDRLGIRNR